MSVLITGAGPTGLVLALWLTQIGIPVRLIDKTSKPGTTSRALAIHARTLEFYHQMGLAEEVVGKGFHFPSINLWVNHTKKAQVSIGQMGRDVTPYSYVIIFPQDQHEELLISHLAKWGVHVERETELLSFDDQGDHIQAELRLPDGKTESFRTDYLAGCDGARSRVREILGEEFKGSTYPDRFYVADIVGRGPALDGQLHLSLDRADFLAIFPLKDSGHARLIGVIRERDFKDNLTWSDVNPRILKEMDIEIDEVRWFSTYHVHHRVAEHFQKGRAFLLGDAGHIHSPVGGQGMNTGIGDAVNLAWKLAEVLKNRASIQILRSYEIERIRFAQQLVHTTDQAFRFVSSEGLWAQFIRTQVAPRVLPAIFDLEITKSFMFRTISQTQISYRHCDLNQGSAGALHAGDRLPWIERTRNFDPLQSKAWQIHLYGNTSATLTASELQIPVHRFDWNKEMAHKGLQQNAVYVIRPDGYIGLITTSDEASQEIQNYFAKL